MSLDFADIIGIIGSLIFIATFAYANVAKALDKLLFNALKLIGAGFLLTSLWFHFNLAAFLLEAAWALIALWGLVVAWRARRKGNENA